MDERASSSTSCRCAANADAMRPSTYSFHADTLHVQHRVQRGGAQRVRRRFCWRFLCRPNRASAEFLDDVIKLGLDRFLVELVIAENGICLARGGDQAAAMSSYPEGPDAGLETGARTTGPGSVRRWRTLKHRCAAAVGARSWPPEKW